MKHNLTSPYSQVIDASTTLSDCEEVHSYMMFILMGCFRIAQGVAICLIEGSQSWREAAMHAKDLIVYDCGEAAGE